MDYKIKKEIYILKSIKHNLCKDWYYINILELVKTLKKIKLCYYSTSLHMFVEISDNKKEVIKEGIICGYLIDVQLILEGLIKEKEWELSYYTFTNLKNNLNLLREKELIELWENFHSKSFMKTFDILLKLRYETLLKNYAINNENENPLNDIVMQIAEDIAKRGL